MRRHERILRDIAALYAKYGADEIDAAIRDLRSGEALSVLTQVIDTVGAAFAEKKPASGEHRSGAKSRPSKSSRERLQDYLQALRKERSTKTQLVAELIGRADRGEVLSSRKSIDQYSQVLGIPPPRAAKDRHLALMKLAQNLLELPEAGVQAAVEHVALQNDEGSSLDEWARIIVKK